MQETWVFIPGLGRSSGEWNGYPLSILGWRSPQAVGLDRLQFIGSQRVSQDWVMSNNFFFFFLTQPRFWVSNILSSGMPFFERNHKNAKGKVLCLLWHTKIVMVVKSKVDFKNVAGTIWNSYAKTKTLPMYHTIYKNWLEIY